MNVLWLVLPVGVLLLGAVLMAWVIRDFRRGRAAENWPTVAGVVTGTRIRRIQRVRGRPTYHPVVQYRYELGGIAYQGDRLAFGFKVTNGSRSGAEKLLETYPVGSAVPVRYDPARPGQSVLVGGSSTGWMMWNMLGAMFLLVLGGLCVWGVFAR